MPQKINTQIALILILLTAVLAVSVIFMYADQDLTIASRASRQTTDRVKNEADVIQTKVYEKNIPISRYGINAALQMPEGIMANDYGDNLIQFAIKERMDGSGKLAYDGGFPLVGLRFSDPCTGSDVSLMCSHFDSLATKPDFKKWQVGRDAEGRPRSVKRISFFASEEDFYDEYYVKLGNRVVSVYYSETTNPVYTVEGVDLGNLPKLPLLPIEQKTMHDFATNLVGQLEML